MMPRTLVLGANPGRWRHDSPDAQFRNGNGVEAWAYAMEGEYWGVPLPKPPDLDDYELIIANLVFELLPAYRKLQDGSRKATWVSLIEGAGEDYLVDRRNLREVLDASDLVININRLTTEWIRALTKTRVEYLGIPYPIEAMRAMRMPMESRRREMLVCPKRSRGPSIEVAKACGLPIRAFAPKVSRKLSNLPVFVREGRFSRDAAVHRLLDELPPGSIVEFEQDLEPYLSLAAGCYLWVNLDSRHTWGRNVLDAAALGVPVISTIATGHAQVLFPETTVSDVLQVSEAVEIAKRLIGDTAFYKRTVEHAESKLAPLGFNPMANKLVELLEVQAAGQAGEAHAGRV